MRKDLVFAAIVVLSISTQAGTAVAGEPILTVSGDVITISGGQFGQGPTAAVYETFDSDEAEEGQPVSGSTAEIGKLEPHRYYPATYSSESRSGSFSGKLYDGAKAKGTRQLRSYFTPSSEVFVSYWVKISGPPYFPGSQVDKMRTFSGDSSWKLSWLIDQDYKGNSSDVCLPTHVGGGRFMLAGNDYNMVNNIGNDWWSWDHWMQLSFWLKPNVSDPTSPGTITFETRSIDKGYERRIFERPVFDDDGPSEKVYRQINFPGWIRTVKGEATDILYDDLYVAYGPGSVARVEIGDEAFYDESENTYILPINNWSNTEIVARLPEFVKNKAGQKFIYLTDSKGITNQRGIRLPVPPSVISTLEVE